MMRLWLESYTKSSPISASAVVSIVAHAALITAAIAGIQARTSVAGLSALYLLLVLWRHRAASPQVLLARAALRYATLALLLVPPLILAGVVTALDRFSQPAELIGTLYGRILVVKALGAAAALVLALVASFQITPSASFTTSCS